MTSLQCAFLHTSDCASCAEVGRRHLFFFIFLFSQTRRGIFTQTDERRAGADVIPLDDGREGDLERSPLDRLLRDCV